jgi:hypothetical protein
MHTVALLPKPFDFLEKSLPVKLEVVFFLFDLFDLLPSSLSLG